LTYFLKADEALVAVSSISRLKNDPGTELELFPTFSSFGDFIFAGIDLKMAHVRIYNPSAEISMPPSEYRCTYEHLGQK
jgi:hypothetical protein